MIWTVRNDLRIPLARRSPDTAWPLQLTPRNPPIKAAVPMRDWLNRASSAPAESNSASVVEARAGGES